MDYVRLLETENLKKNVPEFRPGDTVRVHIKVVEGGRERLQAFEGVCIARQNSGLKESFTLRRSSHGVGVERTLLTHSPRVEKIELLRRGHVRRAKLYYLRGRVGRQARIRERKQETPQES